MREAASCERWLDLSAERGKVADVPAWKDDLLLEAAVEDSDWSC